MSTLSTLSTLTLWASEQDDLPVMISLSLGSRLTVQGRKVLMSLAVRTGVLEDRKTSKLRTSPSISSSGSTSLVVGMFLDTLVETRCHGEGGAK